MTRSPEVMIRSSSVLADVEEQQWDRVTPSSGFQSSYQWLRSVESGPLQARRAFVVAEAGGECVGRLAMYRIEEHDFHLINPPSAMLAAHLDAYMAQYWSNDEAAHVAELRAELSRHSDLLYPCAVCISPFGDRVAFDLDPSRANARKSLIDAFFDIAQEWEARSHAFMFVPPGSHDMLRDTLVDDHEFRRVHLGAFSTLSVPTSFAEYLASLPARKRSNVRRELKGFAESDLVLETIRGDQLDDALVRRLATLTALTRARHGYSMDARRAEDVLRSVLHVHAGSVRVFVVSRRGKPVSYSRYFESSSVLYAAVAGQDHDALDPHAYAHFTALYYEPLRYAIESGATEIDFGFGAFKTKLARGAHLSPRPTYVRFDGLDDPRFGELTNLMNVAMTRFFLANDQDIEATPATAGGAPTRAGTDAWRNG